MFTCRKTTDRTFLANFQKIRGNRGKEHALRIHDEFFSPFNTRLALKGWIDKWNYFQGTEENYKYIVFLVFLQTLETFVAFHSG